MTDVWEGLVRDGATDAEIAADAATFEPLAAAVRELVDLTIRTEVDTTTVAAATREVEAVTARLRERLMPGSYGVRIGERSWRTWGNAVDGLRNAVAVPAEMHDDGAGRAWCDVTLGAAYEGPAGLVHGGVAALLLDHVLGVAAGADHTVRMTGTLTLRYRRATRLGVPLHAEAHVDRVDGAKAFVVGHIADADGVTVEAEGLFIAPRWARPSAPEEES